MDADTQRSSTVLHSFLVGQMALHNDDNELALEEFSKASANAGAPSAEIHGRLADLYIKSGQLDKAKAELEAALNVDEKNDEFRLNYAGVLESLGDAQAAAAQYEVVLKSPDVKIQTFIMLASLYARLEDFDKSIKVLKRLLAKDPSESLAHY
jgi:tetratricopeptide (TPR) repeat protein